MIKTKTETVRTIVKYTIVIEGNRLIVIALYTTAVCTWIISCSLWKAKPLFNFQQNINKSRSDDIINDSTMDKFYKVAYDEITVNSNRADPILWAKAFAFAEGNQDKAKALYIKYRVEQLSDLEKNKANEGEKFDINKRQSNKEEQVNLSIQSKFKTETFEDWKKSIDGEVNRKKMLFILLMIVFGLIILLIFFVEIARIFA